MTSEVVLVDPAFCVLQSLPRPQILKEGGRIVSACKSIRQTGVTAIVGQGYFGHASGLYHHAERAGRKNTAGSCGLMLLQELR